MKMFGKKKSPATYDEKYLLQELMMTKKAITFLQRQKNLSYPRLDSDSIRIVVLYRYYIFYSINCQYFFYIFI